MRSLLVLTLLAACSTEERLPEEVRPFDQPTGAAVVHLDTLPARYTLPDSALPEGTSITTRFVIDGLRRRQGRRPRHEAAVPFPTNDTSRRFAPLGMQVFVDGEEVPYSTSAHRGGATGWRLSEGRLHLTWKDGGEPGEVVVEHPRIRRKLERMQYGAAGLSAEQFVRYHVTFDDMTRHGLLLPAPATAEWEVEIPRGATFEAFATLAPHPLQDALGDGAEATLSVVVDGEAHPVSTTRIRPRTERFDRWVGDLSAWGGQTVTLRIETSPAGTADHDYVFLGAPTLSGSPEAAPRRVVVIALDTTRPDHLSLYGYERDTTPNLVRWGESAAVFEQAWAPAPRTRPSFRSATTGRRPLDAVGATNIGAVFRDAGFATAGIVANVHLHPRFDFDDGFDLWWLDPAAKADDQVDRALAWLRENRARDSYLFLHIMDPHIFYVAPEPYGSQFVEDPDPQLPERFNRWQALQWDMRGQVTEQRIATIVGRYDGEIAWTDHQVGRFLDGLAELGDNTLVVLHTDHGEEFWEHGGFEHNHTLYDEVVRAALVLRPPGGTAAAVRVREPATLADIAPTLYDYAGLTEVPPTDGRSLRPLVDGQDAGGWDRALPVAFLMYDTERWGVVWRDHKYILHTASGREELYHLPGDPSEQRDISEDTDLTPFRSALAEAHGIPVGPGWRLAIRLVPGRDLTLELPATAVAAGVVDPEALRSNRSNQAWGEPEGRAADEVAKVALSADRRTLTVTPGADADGMLYVLFDAPTPPGGTLSRDGRKLPLEAGADGTATWTAPRERVELRPGTVLVPPPDEAARMKALAGLEEGSEVSDEEMELLRSLGYVGGGETDEEH